MSLVRRDISEKVKGFIFEHIDSVEQLEVLLFLRNKHDKACTVEEISNELRSNVTSVTVRLNALKSQSLIEEENSSYRYSKTDEIEIIVAELAEEYKVRRTLVLELIFSPLKKMRKFADSFVFGPSDKKKGDSDG